MFDKLRRYYFRIISILITNGYKKAKLLKRYNLYHYIGDNVSIKTTFMPAEPFLVSLHDNVWLAAGVRLITHSLTCDVFNNKNNTNMFKCQFGKIEICENVFVGADSIIMYNVTIGRNCIVAAGAVVTKDVPEGSIVAGVPARVIGKFEDSETKAKDYSNMIIRRGGVSAVSVRSLLAYVDVNFIK